MQVVIHLNQYYDWEPVPSDVEVTQKDINSKKVKPGIDSKWLMRVPKKIETYTHIVLPENQLIAMIIAEGIKNRNALTRMEGTAIYLSRYVMDHHAHKNWMTKIEIQDDSSDLNLLEKTVNLHLDAGNLDENLAVEIKEAYQDVSEEVAEYLKKHFKIKD